MTDKFKFPRRTFLRYSAAAAAAGMAGIWCSWGGFHPDRPADADEVVDRFEQVVEAALSL